MNRGNRHHPNVGWDRFPFRRDYSRGGFTLRRNRRKEFLSETGPTKIVGFGLQRSLGLLEAFDLCPERVDLLLESYFFIPVDIPALGIVT